MCLPGETMLGCCIWYHHRPFLGEAWIVPAVIWANATLAFGRMCNHESDAFVKNMMEKLRCLTLIVTTSDPLYHELEYTPVNMEIKAWINAKRIQAVMKGIVSHAIEDQNNKMSRALLNCASNASVDSNNTGEDDDDENVVTSQAPLASITNVSSRALEAFAFECNVSDASTHLRKTKKEMIHARKGAFPT